MTFWLSLTKRKDYARPSSSKARARNRCFCTLPDAVQQTIFFSSALVQGSEQQEAAKHLVRFFTSPAVAEIVRGTGLDPAAKP